MKSTTNTAKPPAATAAYVVTMLDAAKGELRNAAALRVDPITRLRCILHALTYLSDANASLVPWEMNRG